MNNKEPLVPEGCGYNKIFPHKWCLYTYGVSQSLIESISKIAKYRWGWHFVPTSKMDYRKNNWFEDQTAYLTFENFDDLLQCKLSLSGKN